jgi:L-seryl-tRNA(Ser) seleniumtransferase
MTAWVVRLRAERASEEELAHRLRVGSPAVMARIKEGKLVLDVRTVFAEQEPALIEAVVKATGAGRT